MLNLIARLTWMKASCSRKPTLFQGSVAANIAHRLSTLRRASRLYVLD